MGTSTRKPRHPHSITIAQLTQSYLYWAEASLRPSTAESYKASLCMFRDFTGPDMPVSDLGDMAVQRFLKARLEAGKKPNTVRSDHRRLSAFFAWAVERRHVTRNWAQLAKPPREQRPMLRSTTEDEFERLLTHTFGQDAEYRNRALLWLIHDTGMRLGECATLRTGDIDLDMRLVRIRAEDTKDAEGRVAPFTIPCRDALFNYLALERGKTLTEHLWLSSHGGKPVAVQGLKRELLRIGQRAGIPFGAHDLRRAFVARAIAAGMPESLIMEITGHTGVEMLQRYGKPRARENAMVSYRELLG
jgi:site-specific recombinase XerD